MKALENGNNLDSVYLDFQKAFDQSDFGVILERCKHLGITGKIGSWLHSYLIERIQYVIVNNDISRIAHVRSGVPQGSVLGPLLFLILIDSISNMNLTCNLGIFVDDTHAIQEIATNIDAQDLQSDLNHLYTWAKDNNMTFNGDKFEVIKHGDKKDLKESYKYSNSVKDIDDVTNLRDLGVIISNDGTYREHIAKIVKKAKRLSGWIERSFYRNDIHWRRHMLRTYILPVMDYASQVWSPVNQAELNELESVQRTYTHRTEDMSNLDYWQRLQKMNLQSIQRRHERYKIIYHWKLINGLVPQCDIRWTDNDRRGIMISIPSIKSKHSALVVNMRQSSLAVHGGSMFNMLPFYIRNFKGTLSEFKSCLDDFLCQIPDQPAIQGMYPEPITRSNVTKIRNSNALIDWITHLGLRDRRIDIPDDISN